MNLHYKEMLVNFFFYLNYFKSFYGRYFQLKRKRLIPKKQYKENLMVGQRLLKRKGLLVA